MTSTTKHTWKFRACFRRNAFGWRSQPAIKRIKEAVSEIKKISRKNPILGGEGSVLFFEKISPAIEEVDSSSGAIGTAVNNAIDALVSIIAKAPADEKQRNNWLERLWHAVEADDIPYIETLCDHWGELCASPEYASRWADRFIDTVRIALGPNPKLYGYFKGTSVCLSALLKSGRNTEIMELLERMPHKFWHYREWGVKALLAMGKKAEALSFAEDSRGLNEPNHIISEACEKILLESGMVEEAYNRYAIDANQKTTYLSTFRAIVKKYPNKDPMNILKDLVSSTPGDEGKWFAAAKWAGLYEEAIELVNCSPCDPRTLIRAVRDTVEVEPEFAVECGVAALRWIVDGYGYEITTLDVWSAYEYTMKAAKNSGCKPIIFEHIRRMVSNEKCKDRFVAMVLRHELGLK